MSNRSKSSNISCRLCNISEKASNLIVCCDCYKKYFKRFNVINNILIIRDENYKVHKECLIKLIENYKYDTPPLYMNSSFLFIIKLDVKYVTSLTLCL